MKLKMERTGQFKVNWTGSNQTQCGVAGQDIISYRVTLESSDKHLNQQGFIIDNNDIQKYFADKYKLTKNFVSCELIAATACREFRKMMPHLYSLAVSISGNPGAAWLTAHWARDEDLPVNSSPKKA